MSDQLTPSKRQLEGIQFGTSGRGKLHKSAASRQQSFSSGSVIRILCASSKIGSVIGKGGSIISQIRQETGVRVRVDDNVPRSDERIIFIISPDRANKEKETREIENDVSEQAKENKDTKVDEKGGDIEEDGKGGEENVDVEIKQQDGDEEETRLDLEKEKENIHDLEMENKMNMGVQKALLLVFEKMVEGELERNGKELEKIEGEDEARNSPSSYVIRLIVFSSQIECLLGKDDCLIKEMSSESGAHIKVIPRDKLPSLVSASDELVLITGAPDAVKKALISISQKLLENPSPDQHVLLATYTSGPSTQSVGRPHRPFHGHSAGFRDCDGQRLNPFPDLLTFHLWCPHHKIGGVIGKAGAVVSAIQNETGCEIKVQDCDAASEDRVIVISGPVHPDDQISAPQDALLRVQFRIFRSSPENGEKNMLAKLLVSSDQIGCLLGKGGSIIAEMRKSTGAYIRILAKDQIPKGASVGVEVVQINGDVERVEDALIQITTRLREHFFRDSFPSMNYSQNPGSREQRPSLPPYMGMRRHSPPRRYPNQGPPYGGFHPHDERPPHMQHFPRPGPPGRPHQLSERMPNSTSWGPQGPMEGGGGPLGLPDYPRGPSRRNGGGYGGGNPTVITRTKIEVVVPRAVVPSIYGEDGGCLRLIREISDARVNITDPKPGANDTTVIISGTPDQTNAAQSLIQAFVVCETEST